MNDTRTNETLDIIERLARQIARVPPSDSAFTRDTELFDSGYIDSLGIVKLTAALEQSFHITLSEEDLFSPLFTTINGLARMVGRHQAESTQEQ